MENNNDKNQQKPTNLIDKQTGLNAKQIEAATLIVPVNNNKYCQ